MSEQSVEILIGGSTTPPEMDNYSEDEDMRTLISIYESSSYDILEQMNKESFYDTYNVLKTDITNLSEYEGLEVLVKVFIDKYLDRMLEIYEFEFSPVPVYDTVSAIDKMFKFIEFVEFDNINFLKYVWGYLDNILSVNIENYVRDNEEVIIEEITNQVNLLQSLNENISEFLRTYDKEGLLNWFINRSKRYKFEIYSENVE
jgi:hypothetical protein